MVKAVFVHGISGAGKTRYAEPLAEKLGYKFVHGDCKKNLVLRLINCVVDGINLELIEREAKKFDEVEHVVVVAPYWVIKHRQKYDRKIKNTKEEYFLFYENLFNNPFLLKDKDYKIIDSLTIEEVKEKDNYVEVINSPPTLNEVQDLKQKIKDECGDKSYHPIDLLGEKIEGVVPTEQTWEVLKQICDFKDAFVADIGTCTGWFAEKVFEADARNVFATETHGPRFEIARGLARIKKIPNQYVFHDICKEGFSFYRDYTLVLNIYHWLEDKQKALEHIFANTRSVIFEINTGHFEEIDEFAKAHKYKLVFKTDGRTNRFILRYDRK